MFISWDWFKIAESRSSLKTIKSTCSASDYTIMITYNINIIKYRRLPHHSSIAQLYFWLKCHFEHLLKDYIDCSGIERHGKICDINFGYIDQGEGINLYNKRGELLLEYQEVYFKYFLVGFKTKSFK